MIRRFSIIIFLASLLVLIASYYFQYGMDMEPCPLCLMQRFCVGMVAITSLFMLKRRSYKVMHTLLFLVMWLAIFGFYFAIRQLWLQTLSDHSVTCMPALGVMLQYFPWQDIVKVLFLGAADCALVSWTFLSLPMAGWSAIYFAVTAILAIVTVVLLRKKARDG